MASAAEFLVAQARFLAEEVLARAREACKSRTLAKSMELIEGAVPGEARINVPHYWAVFYHDGRGPIRAKPGHYLVYFKRPEDDPRTDGGSNYPTRSAEVRRLSRNEFYRYLREGKIVVTRSVGPAPGNKFFESPSVRATAIRAGQEVPSAFSDWVKDNLGPDLNVSMETTID